MTAATDHAAPDTTPAGREISRDRKRTWWRRPTALTVFALLALLAFGIGGKFRWGTTFTFAEASDLVAIPPVTLPSGGTALALSLLLVALAGVVWWQAWTVRPTPAWLLTAFGLLWVLAFLVWIVAGQTLPITDLLQATLALGVPLVFGALSGVLSERSGVINIAIEGQLLFGAFGAAIVASFTGSLVLGVIAAPIVALVIGALLALFAVGYAVQQIIVGVVLNLFAVGLTSFFFGTLMADDPARFNSANLLPSVPNALSSLPGIGPVLSPIMGVLVGIPIIGPVLINQNVLVYLMYVIVAVLTIALFKSRWGLRVRAVGEHPLAADTVGIKVNATRWQNVLLGSAVAGLGGATFTLGTGVAFGEEMSAGNGYIALAAMILGRYHPIGALAAALFFAFAKALQGQLGILQTSIPPDLDKFTIDGHFLLMLPYVVTLLAVSGFVGRVRVPAADGQPYVKQ